MDVVEGEGSTTPLSGIVQVSSGDGYSCALTSGGNVKCWGDGGFGKLGNGLDGDNDFPVDVIAGQGSNDLLSGIVQISTGVHHVCALTSQGNVKCWGRNREGQLGNDTTTESNYPVDVVASDGSATALNGIIQISARGARHTCVLTSGGNVKCWGSGAYGQLGSSEETTSLPDEPDPLGLSRDAPLPVLVESGGVALSGVARVGTGGNHSCAIMNEGNVKCWGAGTSGELGNNTYNQSYFPVDVVATDGSGNSLSGITQVMGGVEFTCALTSGGGVKCWGVGRSGRLGYGSSNNRNYPVDVIAGKGSTAALSGILAISVGGGHVCALLGVGKTVCWGHNYYGQLGKGSSGNTNHPVTVVAGENSSDFLNVGTYQRSYTCTDDGSVSCAIDPVSLTLATGDASPSSSDDAPSIEVVGLGTGETLTLYSDNDCSTQEGTASSSSTTIALSGLSEQVHRFYFDILDSSSKRSDCYPNSISYVYDATAPAAVTVSLSTDTGSNTTPVVTVAGVTPGHLVKVYSDGGCSTSAAPDTRVDGVSADITVSEISTTTTFYATATDLAGNESGCSASGATYTLNP